MNPTIAATAGEATETKCDKQDDACSLILRLPRSARERISKQLASNHDDGASAVRSELFRAAGAIAERIIDECAPVIGPFSGLPLSDVGDIVSFIRDVDSDCGMAVEALDVILGAYQQHINFEGGGLGAKFDVKSAIREACCEWDL